MEIKSFWIIVLRITGIWLIIDSLGVIGQFFSSFFILFTSDGMDQLTTIAAFISLMIVVAVYFLCIRLFIVKPVWLISKLKLDQDFNDSKLEIRPDNETIIRMASFILGGVLITDGLPNLVYEAYRFFQSRVIFSEHIRTPEIVLEIAKCILAYFLVANNKSFARFLSSRLKNNDLIDE
ncbi:MAG: hypothetical protein ACO1O6_05340 [Bacteroidota bacterium]